MFLNHAATRRILPITLLGALLSCGLFWMTTPRGQPASVRAMPVSDQAPISNHASEGNHRPSEAFYGMKFERQPSAGELTALGRTLFFDTALSASGKMACATCHDPAHAYGPANRRAVQLGGPDGRLPGMRAVPSLTYQQAVPAFDEHLHDTDGDDSIDQGPAGGRGWDGRASSAHEQASTPLLSPFEMANPDSRAAVANLIRSPSATAFRQVFGDHALDDSDKAWRGILWALEVFQQSPADFYPYTSKYDAWLRRQTDLTQQEQRGLALFNDEAKGNCASCHPSQIKRGAFPQFTDYGLIAVGVPRNPAIPANRDPKFFDLGLCGPVRRDLKDHPEYCGLFKTPSLRNAALRPVFFHNGVYRSLSDVVRFYAQRDTHPGGIYPKGHDGRPQRFDDLPAKFHDNINVDPPFDRRPGDKPALTEAEIADVVAFLGTLTDGYHPRR